MYKVTRRSFLVGGGVIAAVTLGELGRGQHSVANPKVVNVYSARHYDSDKKIFANFTQKTGIKVNVVEGKAEELVERIKSEGANSPADMLITVDAGNLWRTQQAGVLQPISSSVLTSAIPASLRDSGNHWFGLSKRARVIVYNKAKVNPAQLSTYEDLANPKWKGKVLTRSSTNIYNQSMVASMIETQGAANVEKWAKGLVANFARPPEGNDTSQIQAVAAGIGDVALVNTYYLARLANSSKPEEKEIANKVGLFFPNQRQRGTHINISGAGVAKNAPNRAGAIQLLEFFVTPEAQKLFAEGNFEYPVVSSVPTAKVVSQFGTFKSDAVNVTSFGKRSAEAIKLMDRSGWK